MMACLLIHKGPNEGQRLSLDGEKIILGRSPDCQLTLPGTAVSRQHALIVRAQGKHFIEDLASRNKTFLNNLELTPRNQVLLRDNDRIRIANFLFSFHDGSATVAPTVEGLSRQAEPAEESGSTIFEAALTPNSQLILQTQTAENLRMILEANNRFSNSLEMDLLLPKIGEALSQIFKQADRCLVILRSDITDKLHPRVIKARSPQDEANVRFSRSIVMRCLENVQAFLSNDVSTDSRIPLSQSILEVHIRSVMCAPLCNSEGEPFGVLQLDNQDASKKFTQDDLKLLMGVAHQASIALANAKMYEHLLSREQVERDLELAGQMQRSLLPEQLPQVPGYDFFAYYAAALEVGGDYYDFIPLAQKRLAITLGDVAGKGISAAMLMAKLSSDARSCLQADADLGVAASRLNNLIYKNTSLTERFITFVIAVLDPIKHTANIVSAGHLQPLLYRSETNVVCEAIPREQAGMPLGVQIDQSFNAYSVTLEPGDCLLLFTDGVSDAVNIRDQQFQVKGIYSVIRSGSLTTPESIGQRIIGALENHVAGRSQHDDVTLVCFGRKGRT